MVLVVGLVGVRVEPLGLERLLAGLLDLQGSQVTRLSVVVSHLRVAESNVRWQWTIAVCLRRRQLVVEDRVGIGLVPGHHVGIRIDVLVGLLGDWPWVYRPVGVSGWTTAVGNGGLHAGVVGLVDALHLAESALVEEHAVDHGRLTEKMERLHKQTRQQSLKAPWK